MLQLKSFSRPNFFLYDKAKYSVWQVATVLATDVIERSGPVYVDIGCTLAVNANTVTVMSLDDDHVQYADIKHQAHDVKQQCDSDSSVKIEPGT